MFDKQQPSNGTHKRSWTVLEEVNGLKNEEIAVLVTTTNNFDQAYLRERCVPCYHLYHDLMCSNENSCLVTESSPAQGLG